MEKNKICYPPPYFDAEGNYWVYDYEIGWQCAKSMERLGNLCFPKTDVISGSAHSVDFEIIWFNPEMS